MHRSLVVSAMSGLLLGCAAEPSKATAIASPAAGAPPVERPASSDTTVREYHGQSIAEPYGWLEAMESDRVRSWASQQDQQARAFLQDDRAREIAERIQLAADVTRFGPPLRRADLYFYVTFDGAATRASVWVQDGLAKSPHRLIAEQDLAREDQVLHRQIWPSPDGRHLAYGVTDPGSSWMEVRIRDMKLERDLPERLAGLVAFSSTISWSTDGTSFYYERFELPPVETRLHSRVRDENVLRHVLGTPQERDTVVFTSTDPDNQILAQSLSDDGRFLVITSRDGRASHTRVMVRDSTGNDVQELGRGLEASFSFVGTHRHEIWLLTDWEAPRGRIVAVDMGRPSPEHWRTLVEERSDATVDTFVGARGMGRGFVVAYRQNSRLRFEYFDPRGALLRRFDPPNLGSVWTGFVGRQGESEVFFTVSSFVDPGTVYRFDLDSGRRSVFRRPDLPYDSAAVIVEQKFYRNGDGRDIPMFLAYHRSSPPDGQRPVMMYGYGFGGWIAAPWFRPHLWEWFESGGAFALPALRGGGEYGETWHQAGVRTNRHNAIADYLAAARWLVEQGLVAPHMLVAETNSAGGPVVAAATLNHPQWFGATILSFPLLDLLGYERYTYGGRWRSELGTVEDREEFLALLADSPVHNVRDHVCYPPTMVAPGALDEITPPVHAYKFTAALLDAQACDNPVVMRVGREAGHAYGGDAVETAESLAAQLVFLRKVLPTAGER